MKPKFRSGESTPAFDGLYFAAVSDSGVAGHPSIYYSYQVEYEGWSSWMVFSMTHLETSNASLAL